MRKSSIGVTTGILRAVHVGTSLFCVPAGTGDGVGNEVGHQPRDVSNVTVALALSPENHPVVLYTRLRLHPFDTTAGCIQDWRNRRFRVPPGIGAASASGCPPASPGHSLLRACHCPS